MKKKTASLKTANEELEQFAYRASHDLKAPLSTSKNLASFVIDDIKTKNLVEAEENAEKIYTQLTRLENLVTDILSLAEAELGKKKKERIDFVYMVKQIKQNLLWLFEQESCDLISEIKVTKVIYSQKARLYQILENLVSNSIKYRDIKKSNNFVKIEIYNEKKELIIIISDNGIGVPKERHEKIFDMFTRFHPHLSSGSGLGTSIVKKHIDYFSGKINFESSKKGTIFKINIPI